MTVEPHNRWGILFDWDGVVIDSSKQHERSWERVAEAEGLALPARPFQAWVRHEE